MKVRKPIAKTVKMPTNAIGIKTKKSKAKTKRKTPVTTTGKRGYTKGKSTMALLKDGKKGKVIGGLRLLKNSLPSSKKSKYTAVLSRFEKRVKDISDKEITVLYNKLKKLSPTPTTSQIVDTLEFVRNFHSKGRGKQSLTVKNTNWKQFFK